MIVYRATNTVNGKVYIGQTILTAKARWKQHVYNSRTAGNRLARAIRKYGPNAFVVEEIDRAITAAELNEKEILHIKCCRSCDPAVGYNSTTGGEGGARTSEVKDRQSRVRFELWSDPDFKLKMKGHTKLQYSRILTATRKRVTKYVRGNNPCYYCQSSNHASCRPKLDGSLCSCSCERAVEKRADTQNS
jgi:group I intron endonuclease